MKRMFAFGLGALMLAGLGLALLIRPQETQPQDRDDYVGGLPSLESVLSSDESMDESGSDATLGAETVARAANMAAVDPDAPRDFVFERLEIKTDADTPEACLVFSEPLTEDASINFTDYLVIEPEVQPAIRAEGSLLCLAGLTFGQTYQVTVRKGLPAASGSKTPYDETVPVSLEDRPAAISFGSGLILPREGNDGVPITTVNVDRVKLRVARVGERLLSQLRQGLVEQRRLTSWEFDRVAENQGQIVWTGEMAIAGSRNETVRTLFPIRQALPKRENGVYLVAAENAADEEKDAYARLSASQWIIESDLALTSFSGADGLRVFVRSLSKAGAVEGVRVTLLARNNEILGEVRTGADGGVRFDPGLTRGQGGNAPVMVMAERGDDFMFLDLRRAAFDLSDRGVSGRPAPAETDAFVYLDRGIYRPGETVQIVSLLRDAAVNVIENASLTLLVRRPDGIEYRRLTVDNLVAGGVHVPVTLSRSAMRGPWTVSVHTDPRGPAVGSARFDVQDFVPERLEVALETGADFLRPTDDIQIDVAARYLYGAPAKGLEGEATMRIVPDPEPFKAYTDYSFGLVEQRFSPTLEDLSVTPTDDEGNATVSGKVGPLEAVARPLRADITVSVFEPGGRPTRERLSIPIRPLDVSIGIRPGFDNQVVRRNTPMTFDVLALDPSGLSVAAEGVKWELVARVVNYQWYQADGEWRYERIVRNRPLQAGTIDVTASSELPDAKPARIEIGGLDWGHYQLTIRDPATGAASSLRFWSGWYGGTSDQRPDRVTVLSGKPRYRAGETARITIRPPMPGKALLTVAGASVHETRLLDLPADGVTLDLPVSADWGSGAYVIVNAYRPVDGSGSQVPVRAIGLAHIAIDQSDRSLAVAFDMPDLVEPQSDITVPVRVQRGSGNAPPSMAFVTLAAVDTGILNLTDFEPPSPEDHYFGKRRLAVEIRDDYGRLIRGARGVQGEIRSGGDGFADAGGLNVVPTRTVALFSGIVALDEAGSAAIPLTIPDFVGELTFMAVAFSPTAVGHGVKPVTVRRAVVGDLALPRFLAPGDEAQATLQVNNVEGPAGAYQARVTTDGALTAAEVVLEGDDLRLATGEESRLPVPLKAERPGVAEVSLDLSGPDDFSLARSWPIESRAPRLPRVEVVAGVLEPGTELDYDDSLLTPFHEETAAFSLSLSSAPAVDVPGLLRALGRYPYGCLEQTTSRAFPLLYFNDLAVASGVAGDDGLKQRLQDAADKILDLQRPDGAFGMWSRSGGSANLWLSVFALDFLAAAKEQGFVVPRDAILRGQSWLTNLAEANWQDVDARAYAFYALAKQGRARISAVRYFFDTERTKLKSAIGLGFLGGALDALGDRARGRIAFSEAVERLAAGNTEKYKTIAYGSLRRDLAGVTALVAEARRLEFLPPLFERRAELAVRPQFATTQEMVWMLLTAHHLRSALENATLSVVVKGTEPQEDPGMISLAPSRPELARGITIGNTGDEPLWYVATAEGTSMEAEEPESNGLSVTKTLLSLDGEPVDPGSLERSGRYVVLIQGRMNNNRRREMAVLDLLPAGFEIETVLPGGVGQDAQYPQLPKLTYTQLASARDDRFVAAFNIGGRRYRRRRDDEEQKVVRPTFALAYIVRAVTPGDFALPAVRVEDMYAPRIMARTNEGRVIVAPGAP